uniref:Colony stimulating factor 3 (granulocyte) a n=1 Tax=Sinocyclocheilus rhinocerous TaxID=307959 RepID=A0A673KVM6_9TELE
MIGLCYCWSLVTAHFLFDLALLVTLVGIMASAPISDKLGIMNKDTIVQAHILINKILKDIPTTHAAWINNKSLTLGDSTTRLQLEFLRKSMIPSAPVLQNISSISSMETCLAHIVKGLQLHLNLLNEISKELAQTDQVNELKAEIQELRSLIKKLQNQAGFDPSKQASDEQSQTPEHDLAKHLTNKYMTQVAAHLTLQQLQNFSCDVLRSILSIRRMTSNMSMAENPNTVQLCINTAGL